MDCVGAQKKQKLPSNFNSHQDTKKKIWFELKHINSPTKQSDNVKLRKIQA